MLPSAHAPLPLTANKRLSCHGYEYSLQDLHDRLASPTGCLNDELIAVLLASSIRRNTVPDRAVVVPYWQGACMAGSPSNLARLRPETVLRALGGRSIMCRYALMIVHVQGNHWLACAAFVPGPSEQGRLAFYDSLALDPNAPRLTCSVGVNLTGMAARIAEQLETTLSVPLERGWDVRLVQAPLQANVFDCGLHAALALTHLSDSIDQHGGVDLFQPPPWRFNSSMIPAVRQGTARAIRENSIEVVTASDSDDGGDRLKDLATAATTAERTPLRWKRYATVQAMLRQHNMVILEHAKALGWDGVLDQDMLVYLHSGRNPEWQVNIFSLTQTSLVSEFKVNWTAENIFICVQIELSFTPLLQIQHGVLTLHQRPDMRQVRWCGAVTKLSQENKTEIPPRSSSRDLLLEFLLHGKVYQITLCR